MPFVKDDPNINKLDTLPEKFTKEFVDYVCHLYANNTSVLEMSEILNTPQNTITKKISCLKYGKDEAKAVALKYIKEMKMLIQQELFYLRGEKCHL